MIGMIKCRPFESIYKKQIEFQKMVCKKSPYEFEVLDLPEDNVKGCSYHLQQLVSEIGEVLSADKRWKSYRNSKNDSENKKEEIADCFIVLMNVAIFSGLSLKIFPNFPEKIFSIFLLLIKFPKIYNIISINMQIFYQQIIQLI